MMCVTHAFRMNFVWVWVFFFVFYGAAVEYVGDRAAITYI